MSPLIVGIGNPLLDIIASVPLSLLEKYKLEPNSAILADESHLELYEELYNNYTCNFVSGGSAQNTMRVSQWLLKEPYSCGYIGCVGKDKYATIMRENCEREKLLTLYEEDSKAKTGICAVLVNEEHRSLVANLSAANNFTYTYLDTPKVKDVIKNANLVYLSGFFLTVCSKGALKVAKECEANNIIFSMNFAAQFIVECFNEALISLLPYCDLIIGNELEARAFSKKSSFETDDLHEIAIRIENLYKSNTQRPRVVIITQGPNPTLVCVKGIVTENPVPTLTSEEIIDTNAAGDAFVGGFISKYVSNRDISECIECAHYAARTVIKQSGCTLPLS